MKKIGIILIVLYLLLTLSLLFPSLELIGAIGLVIYLPVILILASTNILADDSYGGRKVLVILSVTSIILLTLSKVGVQLIPSFWKYADWSFYISIILFVGASGLVLNNTITSKSSIRITTDSIILLIPLTAFFLLEYFHFNHYIHKSNVERIDFLVRELDRTNALIATEYGAGESLGRLNNLDTLKYGEIIKAIDDLYYKVAEYSGGFKMGYADVLFNPHKTVYPDRALEETTLLELLRSKFEEVLSGENNESDKTILAEIRDDLFGDSVYGNTVLEFRIRSAIARNRLIWLEKRKGEPDTPSHSPHLIELFQD